MKILLILALLVFAFPVHLYHDIRPVMFPNTEIKSTKEEKRKITIEVSAYTPYDETCNGDGITASGVPAVPGYTCACNEFPFGTLIEIDGHIWEVQDRMAFDGCIDLCMSTKDECFQFGRQIKEVRVE